MKYSSQQKKKCKNRINREEQPALLTASFPFVNPAAAASATA